MFKRNSKNPENSEKKKKKLFGLGKKSKKELNTPENIEEVPILTEQYDGITNQEEQFEHKSSIWDSNPNFDELDVAGSNISDEPIESVDEFDYLGEDDFKRSAISESSDDLFNFDTDNASPLSKEEESLFAKDLDSDDELDEIDYLSDIDYDSEYSCEDHQDGSNVESLNVDDNESLAEDYTDDSLSFEDDTVVKSDGSEDESEKESNSPIEELVEKECYPDDEPFIVGDICPVNDESLVEESVIEKELTEEQKSSALVTFLSSCPFDSSTQQFITDIFDDNFVFDSSVEEDAINKKIKEKKFADESKFVFMAGPVPNVQGFNDSDFVYKS